jgi:multidrug efflux pump
MSGFFIRRPIFAWVLAIVTMLVGILSISRLPIARYPNMAPVAVAIHASYPGASAQTAEDSVTQIIEQNMTGLDGLLYFSSRSDNAGSIGITLTFASGTSFDTAQVQVQNKLQQALALLPQIVQQQGVSVGRATGAYQMVLAFFSADGRLSAGDISDYLATNVVEPLSRVPGVGSVDLFGSKYAMRIWLDAGKLNAYSLTPGDVAAAVRGQNAQISMGQFGDLPADPAQQLNAPITALGRLQTPEQFRAIIVRSNVDGSVLRLGDVARVELGQASYGTSALYNGKPASGFGVSLSTTGNALSAARSIDELLARLKPSFPAGLKSVVAYDTTPYVRKSIVQVIKTLIEAVVLVFIVIFVFLQDLRATLIPTITVPVVVLGTFAVLAAAGLSINMLTIFALVLAIGLLVDDAIVVVENVERQIEAEGLSPKEATLRSMEQVRGALIGIAVVLSVVFIPMAFLDGAIGIIYRQFSITIVSAMTLSVIIAIVLTPTLCATLLRPRIAAKVTRKNRFLRMFDASYARAASWHGTALAHIFARRGWYLGVFVAIVLLAAFLLVRLPTTFLPQEDEGYLFALVQAPVGATEPVARKALDQVREYFLEQERKAALSVFQIEGFNFSGSGQNAAFGFVLLKDWSERKSPELSLQSVQQRATVALAKLTAAQAFVFAPPPNVDLGDLAGFDFYLKDDGGHGHQALVAARDQFLSLAAKSKLLANVSPNGQDDAPQFRLDIDTQKVLAFGLSMDDVNETLSMAWGGRYIDDFVDRGRVKRVMVQADAPSRSTPEDFKTWFVRNKAGEMVSVGSFARSRWEYGPPQLTRYNGAAAMEIIGEAPPGVSSGSAMKEIESLVAKLPPGFSAEFTGQSFDERAAGAQAPILYAFSTIVVFLCLAALYESWSIPTAVLLTVPLGVIGAVGATVLRGLERDVYFEIAMLTTAGLSSKNAILIIEFARQYAEQGMPLVQATLRAAHDRLRPILMTSLAFGLGVLPLALATGAGAAAQRAIGTGVFGGMLTGTFLGILFVPLFFVTVSSVFSRSSRPESGSLQTGTAFTVDQADRGA